jgi:very-short-patch-repair endonuclease
MEKFGFKIIRFRNSEVENDIEKVITGIKSIVNKRLESPPWGI